VLNVVNIIDGSVESVSVSGQPVFVYISGGTLTASVSGQPVFVYISGGTLTASVSGQPVKISGESVSTSISGNTVSASVSGNAIFVYQSGTLARTISGNAVSISGNAIITSISGNVIQTSGQCVFVYISGGGISITSGTVSISGQTITTSISGQDVNANVSGETMVVLNPTDFKTWGGRYYRCDDYITAMALNAVRWYSVFTSNQNVHFTALFSTKSDYYITVYESSTVTSNGFVVAITNANRISGVSTVTTIYTSSTVVSNGLQIAQYYIPIGGVTTNMSQEFVFKQSTKYTIKLTSLAASNIVNPVYYFYEGES